MIKRILTLFALCSLFSVLHGQITLTWTDNADNETGQEVERKLDSGPWVLLAELGPDVETYVDNFTVLGALHTYRVRALNAGGYSDYSNEASTLPAVAPATPSALAIPVAGRLVNISGRGFVGVDAQMHIGGFVIQGDTPVRVLIRGVGPELTRLNVPGALEDPQLVLFRNPQTELARNDNWGSEGDTEAINAARQAVFAFGLAAGSKDAAILTTLDPGQYTVHLSGVGGTTGVALLEIYAVP